MQRCFFSSASNTSKSLQDKWSRAWVVKNYNKPLIKQNVPVPQLWAEDQVLIKVKASSINPIDTRMTEGYGNEVLSNLRRLELNHWNPISFLCNSSTNYSRLPLITGRDCSGEIVEVGSRVSNFQSGDEVIAVIPAAWQGSHTDYVVAPVYGIAPKPKSVNHVEACALAYTACTAWAALVNIARIKPTPNGSKNCRVLIHGGSGGVGTTSIQFLRAWGSPKVVATCSEKNMDLVKSLGAIPIDYNSPTAKQDIIAAGPYEVVFDCAHSELTEWSDQIMGIWRNCVHLSVVSPLLKDTDRYGLPAGLATTFLKYALRSYKPALQGRWFSYAFFMPSAECLTQLSEFIDQKKIVPIVDKIYRFDELPEAYAKVGQLKNRGKSVVDLTLD